MVPRSQQLAGLEFLKKSILSNNKYFLLNLSTGVGKSFLTIMFANWYKNFINELKLDILTNSKVLQNQYIKDFPFIKNFKGKQNYFCQKHSVDCASGKEICKILKTPCETCPYDRAKTAWQSSQIGLTNFHLFGTLAVHQKQILKNRGANVLIVDECHDLESVFSDQLSSTLSARSLKKCGFNLKEIDDYDTKYISKIKTLEKYLEFLDRKLIPDLKRKYDFFEQTIITSDLKKKKEYSLFIQKIENKLFSYEHLFKSHKEDPNNIVLDIVKNKDKMYSGYQLVTNHVWVYEYIEKFIFSKYDHVIFMSASILNKDMFCYINGLDKNITTYFEIPTPFLKKNRKIFYLKVGKMSFKNKEETFLKQVPWIKEILKKYKNEKGIIHTTNYEITEWIKENIQDERLLFHETEDRHDILEQHLHSTKPTVLVSPSMISGISLDDDLARFQILVKTPFPNISSAKIKARQKTNPNWYTWKACTDILQAYGRGVRSETDFCDFYILDSNFSDLLKYNSHMFPKYFLDAIKTLKI